MRLAKHSLRPLLALFRSRGREKRVPLQQPGWTTRIQTAQSGDRRCEWTYLLFFWGSLFRKKKGVEVKRKSRRQRFVERIFCLTLFAFFFPPPLSSVVVARDRHRERERAHFDLLSHVSEFHRVSSHVGLRGDLRQTNARKRVRKKTLLTLKKKGEKLDGG